MTLLEILLILFWVVNVLDALTTYLCLFRLPPHLQGKEANPLFKGGIKKSFGKSMFLKFMIVMAGTYLFLYIFRQSPGQGITAFLILDILFGLAVVNNSYIYIRRKVTGRMSNTPVGFISGLLQRIKIPGKVADIIAYFAVIGAAYAFVTYLIYFIWGV